MEVTISTTAEVRVVASSEEEARQKVHAQMNERHSPATTELAEAFGQIVRQEHFEYSLDAEVAPDDVEDDPA
ncbi:hypothetical protein [Deinococcus aluminii]|uniref:Uncharacterized protein n=1 Tax=Deinococcus aluminii TaxID=1656885 RepID=A0ABP9XG54_9DEIO